MEKITVLLTISPGERGMGQHLDHILQSGAQLNHNERGININELICTEMDSLILQPDRAAQQEGGEPGSCGCFLRLASHQCWETPKQGSTPRTLLCTSPAASWILTLQHGEPEDWLQSSCF